MRDRAHLQTERSETQQGKQRGEHQRAEENDVEPVPGQRQRIAEQQLTAHPLRSRDRAVQRREHAAHDLLQKQADSKGREQRLERATVEEAHDATLDDDADRDRDQESCRDGDEDRALEMLGQGLLHDIGGVVADHHHLAMGHVDHPHHAKGDGKPGGGQHQHEAQAQAEEERLDEFVTRAARIDIADRGGGRDAYVQRGFQRLALRVTCDQGREAIAHFA